MNALSKRVLTRWCAMDLPRAAWCWAAVGLIGLSACGGHPAQAPDPQPPVANPPGVPSARVLMASSFGGGDGLGMLSAFTSDDLSKPTSVHTFAGKPWLSFGYEDDDLGMSFNPVDRKFYGVVPISKLGNPEHVAFVIRFDPTTDKVETVGLVPAVVPATGGGVLQDFRKPGVFTPDGKGLMLVAVQGGRDARSAQEDGRQTGGDGALVHLSLEPNDTRSLQLKLVYEFFSYDNGYNGADSRGIRRVVNAPVSGTDASGKSVIHLVAAGEKWNTSTTPREAREVRARALALTPATPGDWSRPWSLIGNWPAVGTEFVGENSATTQAYFDQATKTFGWVAADPTRAGVFFKKAEDALWTEAVKPPPGECVVPVGVSRMQGRTLLLCSGVDDFHDLAKLKGQPGSAYVPNPGIEQAASIMEYVPATNEFISRNTFSAWELTDTKPLAMTASPATGRLYVNVGKKAGDLFLDNIDFLNGLFSKLGLPALSFPSSSLQAIDASLYYTTTLVTGNETLGRYFIGAPAVGGDNSLVDRWIVTLTRLGGANKVGTILKYDRITGAATAVPLGIAPMGGGAYPVGKPHILDNGRVVGSIAAAEVATRVDRLGLNYPGSYVTGESSLTPTLLSNFDFCKANPSGGVAFCPAKALEYARLANGQIWGTGQQSAGGTSVWQIDPITGKPLPSTVVTYSAGILIGDEQPELAYTRIPEYAPAALGNRLFFIAQRRAEDTPGQRMMCTSSTGAFAPASSSEFDYPGQTLDRGVAGAYERANRPVRGGTAFSVNGKMYMMTMKVSDQDEGRIHEVDLSSCDTDFTPRLKTLVRGLTNIPSTKMLETSDRKLVFGTRDGRLMSFNPTDNSVTPLVNLTLAGGSAEVRGFLAEIGGKVRGFVRDTAADGKKTMRLFSFDLTTKNVTAESAPALLNDPYPGLVVQK